MKIIFLAHFFFLFSVFSITLYSKTAIIPYKITNSSTNFPIKLGKEYAKLVMIAATIKKGIDFYPPQKIELDLRSLSLNPQRILTEQDLIMLGNSISADFIMTGCLSKIKESYLSESILYSLRDKRIISNSNIKSSNLFHLAEEDIRSIFFKYSDALDELPSKYPIDVTFLIDISYKISRELDSIKVGLSKFFMSLSNIYGSDIRIYIVPFSNNYTSRSIVCINSPLQIKEKIKKLKPKGISNGKLIEKALFKTFNNIQWRDKAKKAVVIISNSKLRDVKFLEKFSLKARNKRIKMYTISLGLYDRNSYEIMKTLSSIGEGSHFAVSYHQRIYDYNGKGIDIFMESGRLFHTRIYNNEWEKGLYERIGMGVSSYLKIPRSYLNEIFYDEKKYKLNPYNMYKFYPSLVGQKIINSDPVENNIIAVIDEIKNSILNGHYSTSLMKKYLGKVLLSDGKISIWVNVIHKKDLEFFDKRRSLKNNFPLGIAINEKLDEPYMITVCPNFFITKLTFEYIPDLINTNLKNIIQNADYYMNNGLFSPPIWFIKVKVDQVEKYKRVYDIRD